MIRAEYDLPSHFLRTWRPRIDAWLECAKPGDVLTCLVDPLHPPYWHPAVSVANDVLEMHTVDLVAKELPGERGVFLVKPADSRSSRAIDVENAAIRKRLETNQPASLLEAQAFASYRGTLSASLAPAPAAVASGSWA